MATVAFPKENSLNRIFLNYAEILILELRYHFMNNQMIVMNKNRSNNRAIDAHD